MEKIWLDVDWNRSLECVQPRTESLPVTGPSDLTVVSAKFGKQRLKTSSYFFTPHDEDSAPAKPPAGKKPIKESGQPSTDASANDQPPQGTRIKPPKDVVKIDDRLFYLLQPPLENLLAGETLEFPFKPFSFQYAGIAFLFPRQSAILADEMGLGKTMQAITSIRLLLRTGGAQKVLLICPKPLVTNWIREFALWAPEVPRRRNPGQSKTASLALAAQ